MSFVWHELITTDRKKCGPFYSELFGWTCRDVDMGPYTYTVFQEDGKDVAGMIDPLTSYSRAHRPWWSGYIAVEDIEGCVDRIKMLGGEEITTIDEIPDVGRVCMVADPSGAPFCLMQTVEGQQRL